MGNESSLVANCKLESETPVITPKPWRLYQAKRKDGPHLSVFVYETDQLDTSYIENAVKYLKVLRHPAVLKFDAIEYTSDGVWLATEEVTPLESVLEDLSSTEIVAGIYNIIEGLVFLHERAGLSHNNLCLSSIFVSDDGSWRVGGVEYLCRYDQASASYLSKCKQLRDSNAVAPEEAAGKLSSLDHGWARDVYGFGVLMDILLEYITDLGDLKKTFEIRIQDECLNADPNKRPKMSSFLDDYLFKNDFLEISNFLKNVTLKSEDEKQHFFGDITEKLYHLPVKLLASRLVRPLLSRFVLLDANSCQNVIPHLLTPYPDGPRSPYSKCDINPLLPISLFKKHVIPELYKIFHVRDAHIRMVLLAHFDCFVEQFDRNTVQRVLLPQILLGLRDSNDELVRLSLHAIAFLVPLLGGDIVVGTQRGKIFSESTPKFNAAGSVTTGNFSAAPEPNGKMSRNIMDSLTSSRSSSQNTSPSKSPQKKTLKDLAQEQEREKRRQEMKKRNEERQQRRQQREKRSPKLTNMKASDQDTSSTEPGASIVETEGSKPTKDTASESALSDENEDYTQKTESEIDREIEEELDAMETTLPPGGSSKSLSPEKANGYTSYSRSSGFGSQASSGSKGALKLKSKMRTSPPPNKKTSPPSIDTNDQEFDSVVTNEFNNDKWGDEWGSVEPDKWVSDVEGKETTGEVYENMYPSTDQNDKITKDPVSSEAEISSSRTLTDVSKQSSPEKSTPPSGGMSLKSHKNNSDKDKSARVLPQPRTVDLDITKLDIKTSGPAAGASEEDFFADMQPTIKPSANSLWGILNADTKAASNRSSSDKKPQGSKLSLSGDNSSKSSVKFDMVETSQNTGVDDGGWGADDDLAWNEADF